MMSLAVSFQKKRLAIRLVLTARAACDVPDLDAAFEVLQVAEVLLHNGRMTVRDRCGVVGLIVGTHVQVWTLRHPDPLGPPPTHTLQAASVMQGL